MNPRLPILLSLAVLLSACSQQQELRHQANFFGTRVTLTIDENRASAEMAMKEVMGELKTLDSILPPATSKPMRRTNAMLDSGEWFSVNPSIYPLVQQAKSYYRRSHGRFNPATLGALKMLRGDYDTGGVARATDAKEIAALLKHPPTMDDIRVDGIRLRNRNPRLRLDFGLLVYGYAVDAEIAHLRQLGVHNAEITVGPVSRVLGNRQGKAWRVGNDQAGTALALADGEAACLVDLSDAALREDLLDSRAGSVPKETAMVLVIADTASDASVGCTTLALAGPQEWQRAAKDLGIDAALLRTTDGRVLSSKAMDARRQQALTSGKNG